MMKLILAFSIVACTGAFAKAPAKPGASTSSSLDTAKVHADYLDGDFEKATLSLEQWLASGQPMSHSDSVFAFKHLGVMYAAGNTSREKGKHYMLKLLEVEPTARILDMYASDMIYMIFKNIREEFEANKGKLDRAAEHVVGNGQETPVDYASNKPAKPGKDQLKPVPKQASEKGNSHTGYWLAGAGAAIVAAGAVTIFVLNQDPPVKKISYVVQ